MHVEIRFAGHLHLDEIAETEHFELIAVLNQHVEVGIHEAGLMPVRHLERVRPDAVFVVGLVFGFRILRRIDDLDAHLTVPRHLEFRKQVSELRNQRRQ